MPASWSGIPVRRKETMKETLDFAKKLKPDTAQFFPLMVYPGTEAFDWAKKARLPDNNQIMLNG